MNYRGPGIYLHYKGGRYLVMGTAKHTERDEVLVFYTAERPAGSVVHESAVFARPLNNFNEKVNGVAGTSIDGTPRFRRVA